MVGSGPFILASHVPYQRVVLHRNPHYQRHDSAGTALPYLDSVVFSIADDLNARRLRLQNGHVDYLAARPQDYEELADSRSEGEFTIHRLGPALGSACIVFNQNTRVDPSSETPYVDSAALGWFTNTNFRRAVSYALDRQRIIEEVYDGHGHAQWSPLSPANIRFHNPDVRATSYDPDKARALLLAEGFEDSDNDGILEDSAGNPVVFSLLVNDGNLSRIEIGRIVCENLEALGLEVALEVVPQAVLLERFTTPPYDWQAAMTGLTGTIDPALLGQLWCSSGPMHLWHPAQDSPATRWEKAVDSLFAAALSTGDYHKRRALYNDWQYLASKHLPLVFTVLPERVLCIADKFRNINPTLYGGILHNIEEFYVAESDSVAS
jgi:peptide/nickel transport system substrate-binding protein